MKFINWLSRKHKLPTIKFPGGRTAELSLLFIGTILFTLPLYAGIRLEKIAVLHPPYDGFKPQLPVALALSPADRVYLLDAQLASVVELTIDGRALSLVGGPGTGLEQFSDPADICATSGLDVFVADRGNDRIVRLDRKLNYLAEYRTLAGTPAKWAFENPYSVSLGPRGDLFLADGSNNRILKIDPSGEPVFSFGDYGQVKGSLIEPRRLEIDPNGGLWVLDMLGQVIRFDEYGGFILNLQADAAGQPNGLAVSRSFIYVCSDSLLWIYDRISRQTTSFQPVQLGISANSNLVDLAFGRENLWLLTSNGTIHRFKVIDER